MEKTEFDQFASEYVALHAANIRASGERPEYFAGYKVADAAREARLRGVLVERVLDFGSGIGSSIPFFQAAFPRAHLTCADVSSACLEISRNRFPEASACHVELSGKRLPFPDECFDLVFSACVFHHIQHEQHRLWLTELRRVTAPNGMLMLFEHNPRNFLTVAAVRECPFDVNARLVDAKTLLRRVVRSGWRDTSVAYRVFFPHLLAFARPMERFLRRLPLGAQYFVSAKKS
jgi:SAM-dependent methyltransferase